MGEQLNKLRATRAELTVRAGREPEPLELAEFPRTDLEDVERALAVPAEPTNLDAPVGTGDAAGGRGKTTGVDLVAKRAGDASVPAALTLRVHFKTLLETSWSPAIAYESQQVFPHFGRVLIPLHTSSDGFEMRSKPPPTPGDRSGPSRDRGRKA